MFSVWSNLTIDTSWYGNSNGCTNLLPLELANAKNIPTTRNNTI
jgi:hypothetical protein